MCTSPLNGNVCVRIVGVEGCGEWKGPCLCCSFMWTLLKTLTSPKLETTCVRAARSLLRGYLFIVCAAEINGKLWAVVRTQKTSVSVLIG